MSNLTPETLAELRRLLGAGTGLPWHWNRDHARPMLAHGSDAVLCCSALLGPVQSDAELITGAVNALPSLLDAASWSVVHPCKLTHTEPFDFGQCETHDRTFALGETCDHEGLSEIDYLDKREREQRRRAIRALDELEALAAERDALAASVARVRALHKLDHYLGEPGDEDCPHDEDYDGPRHFENEDGMWLCEDTPGEEEICGGCPADEEGERVPWPCPTICALDA